MKRTALEYLDELIACWSSWEVYEEHYLNVHVPNIVRSHGAMKLNPNEKEAIRELRPLLSRQEWQQLPVLIAQRRADNLKELESDLERARAAQEDEREHRQAEEARNERKRALAARLQDAFERDFLSADKVHAADPDAGLIGADEFDGLKTDFVRAWADRELQQPLDHEQAAAVAATSGDVQVVARAGSGKTRTLVTRAIFLQRHCRVSPRELLLLAFNKKAAQEMKVRLSQTLGQDLPHVMTFHALAHALVQPEEDLVFDDASADQFGHSREVQEVIDRHVRSEKHGDLIRDLMLAHFREDWERIVRGHFQMTKDEFLVHRRTLPRESLKGDYVKSTGEKAIANALFEHGIEYKYERNFRWGGVNYRPDFTIPVKPKGEVVVEYFGLKGEPDYDQMSQQKRQFWAGRPQSKFVELTSIDLAKNGEERFVRLLLRKLENAGVSYRRRSEEEIWRLIRGRAIDSFTTAMKNFVGRCRKRDLTPDALVSLVGGHSPCSTAEALFLDVAVSVYREYLQHLGANKKEDFDGLMWRSASVVREGQTSFVRDKGKEHGDVARLRFVMIDEFQDFSNMFFELVAAIRSSNPRAQFFCVGDDWQAINRFAGSDLRFFRDFAAYFHHTTQRHVRANYRSPCSIVEVGNALMYGRGLPAQAKRFDTGSVRICKLEHFEPSASERTKHGGDEITPALLRLVRNLLDRGMDVVLLSRRKGVPWYVSYDESAIGASDRLARFLEHLRSYLPEEDRGRVSISTAHGYKGLEQTAVVVLDANRRSYPLIHPNWVFLRVFGDSLDQIEDEERRLFYVALTRAKETLALLTETPSQSPYLEDVHRRVQIAELPWADLPPVPSLNGARLEIRVFDAYNVKDSIKKQKYRWNAAGRYWHKSVSAEEFSFDALFAQPWARSGVRVEVYSETGELMHQH